MAHIVDVRTIVARSRAACASTKNMKVRGVSTQTGWSSGINCIYRLAALKTHLNGSDSCARLVW